MKHGKTELKKMGPIVYPEDDFNDDSDYDDANCTKNISLFELQKRLNSIFIVYCDGQPIHHAVVCLFVLVLHRL